MSNAAVENCFHANPFRDDVQYYIHKLLVDVLIQ